MILWFLLIGWFIPIIFAIIIHYKKKHTYNRTREVLAWDTLYETISLEHDSTYVSYKEAEEDLKVV